MNKDRREELLDVTDLLSDAIDRLNEIRDDEQEAFDSMPEGLQYSSKGDAMQDALDTLVEFEEIHALSLLKTNIISYRPLLESQLSIFRSLMRWDY